MINMLDVREVRVDLEALANQLESSDTQAATRLRNLNSAVGGGSNAVVWAAADIQQLIAPDLIVERYKRQRGTNRLIIALESVRNILIFLPLVVTWYGISQAVSSYSDLIKVKGGDITLPFLFLWQSGFDGRLQGWQTLGGLAWIDFVLLAFVVILTFAVNVLNDSVKAKREEQAEDLRAHLVHTVARASLCLTKVGDSATAITGFSQSLTRFDDIIRQLLTQMKDISDRQGDQQQLFDTFKRDLVTIMTTVSRAVTELKTSNDALTRNMAALTKPTQEMASQMAPLTANVQQAVNLLQTQIAAEQHIVQVQEKWGSNLQGVLTGVDQAVQAAIGMTNSINNFMQQQQQLVHAMEGERDAEKQVLGEVKMVARTMKVFLDEIESCSIRLSNAVKYIDDVARRFASVVR